MNNLDNEMVLALLFVSVITLACLAMGGVI